MMEINIVGYESKNGFERDMFDHLFDGVKINEYSYDDDPSKIDRPILMFCYDGVGMPDEVLAFSEKLPNRFFCYHRSNEFNYMQHYPTLLQNKVNPYGNSVHSFRANYCPAFDVPNVTHTPLLWGKGFGKMIQPKKKIPKYRSAMIGAMKSDREQVLKIMEYMGDYFHFANDGWLSEDMLKPEECMEIYGSSVICPCPAGNVHPDCNRFAEILNAGGIPVLREYWNRDWHCRIYGFDSPIPFVKSWNELPDVYNMVVNKGVYNFAMEIHKWWYAKRIEIRDNFQNILLEKINV